MRDEYSNSVYLKGFIAIMGALITGCVTTAPSTISGKTYDELEAIGAIEASDSCKFLRDQHESASPMTALAVAGDKAACEAAVARLDTSQSTDTSASTDTSSEAYLDAFAARQPSSLAAFDQSEINCDFSRHLNGPEMFWEAHLGDSPDAFLCSFLNADLPKSETTGVSIIPGPSTGRTSGFLYEIFAWDSAGYRLSELQDANASFHAVNQVSFRPYVYIDPWGNSSYIDRSYEAFRESGGPSQVDHWSEWAEYLYTEYEQQQEKTEYRRILYLPNIDPEYPEIYWARAQCSNIEFYNVRIGNTEWNVDARFHDIDNGFPLIVDRLRAGEKLHEFGRIDGKPIYSSCILRAMVMRSEDNTNVEKSKLVGVYDAIKSKLQSLHPEAFRSDEAKVGDGGSLFYVNDGWTLTFAVGEYQGERYPASVIFEYLPKALDKADKRGADKLAESESDAKISL